MLFAATLADRPAPPIRYQPMTKYGAATVAVTAAPIEPHFTCDANGCYPADATTKTLFVQLQKLINMGGKQLGWANTTWWSVNRTDGVIDWRTFSNYEAIASAVPALMIPPDARHEPNFLAVGSPQIVEALSRWLNVAMPSPIQADVMSSLPSSPVMQPTSSLPLPQVQTAPAPSTPMPDATGAESTVPPAAGTQVTIAPSWNWKDSFKMLTPLQIGAALATVGLAVAGVVTITRRRRRST